MLVSNHKSMIDIMLMLSACDHPVVFVGKKDWIVYQYLDISTVKFVY